MNMAVSKWYIVDIETFIWSLKDGWWLGKTLSTHGEQLTPEKKKTIYERDLNQFGGDILVESSMSKRRQFIFLFSSKKNPFRRCSFGYG